MVRSVGDIPLFKNDEDKEFFLGLIKKYKDMFLFKVYAYCLMDTHGHLEIDSNGADISKFMQSINLCYATYYNKKYNRHGHVFADRFKSFIVGSEAYLITLTGYIHKNPSDINGYESAIEEYRYSSLGIYLGLFNDKYNIVDTSFVMQYFSSNSARARELYAMLVNACEDPKMKEIVEFKNEASEYRSERKILVRDFTPKQIIEFVSRFTENEPDDIHIKKSKKTKDFRSVCALLMRTLCDFTYKEICEFMGNITISQASRLSHMGIDVIKQNTIYQNIISKLINESRKNSALSS